MSFERLFFVRHGEYNRGIGETGLTDLGVKQSRKAGEQLQQLLDGSPARVLSSIATRAVLTSEIIAEVLGAGEVSKSHIIMLIGERPEGVEEIEPWIERAAEEVGLEQTGDLVVVSHQPLLDTVRFGGLRDNGVTNGEVVQFNPGAWENKKFGDHRKIVLELMIADALK